jgi:hypothetical protein
MVNTKSSLDSIETPFLKKFNHKLPTGSTTQTRRTKDKNSRQKSVRFVWSAVILPSSFSWLHLLGKPVLPYAAGGANPIIREGCKFGSRFDTAGLIALGGIVDIAAGFTHKFLGHTIPLSYIFPKTSK